MNISNCLQNDLSLVDLRDLLLKSSVSVTWFGSRVVTVQGYEGSAYLGDFANQLLSFARMNSDTNFLFEERRAGIQVVDTIRQHYERTDNLLQKSILKTTFNFFRKITGYDNDEKVVMPLSTRLFIEDWDTRARFFGFTENQFRLTFPNKELPSESYHTSLIEERLYLVDSL